MKKRCIGLIVLLSFLLSGCVNHNISNPEPLIESTTEIVVSSEVLDTANDSVTNESVTLVSSETFVPFIKPWDNKSPYMELNHNTPFFTEEEKNRTDSFEIYSDLDSLGRCGTAYANVCKELRPTEERGQIGMIKPSGWHTVKYNGVIEGNYLYNRCHLIAYMLTAENDNEKNLITGTRYLNIEGMLPFESKVDDYLDKNPDNHVLYRVTPVFEGSDLVAQGVIMEAWSVEDNGEGVCFCVLCYNAQPGISIDYLSGDSSLIETVQDNFPSVNESDSSDKIDAKTYAYVINIGTKKIHLPSCDSVKDTKEKNKAYTNKTIEELKQEGYVPCKRCNPK